MNGITATKRGVYRALEPGRGVGGSPLFPPQYRENDEACEALLLIIREDPRHLGQKLARWTLDAILRLLTAWKVRTVSGMSRLLRRLGIRYKRGRCHIHSPDPDYIAKLRDIQVLVAKPEAAAGSQVVLFQDEFTYYRQPTLAWAYESVGKEQPKAELSHRSNRSWRVVAVLDVYRGRVIYYQGKVIGVKELIRYYRYICDSYPRSTIHMIQDNWPVHFHPGVLAALQPQQFKWPVHLPASWTKTPSPKWQQLNLPIQLVPLPTYASWANPIEKVWRKLKQEELHLHRLADDWDQLRRSVGEFLDRFADSSPDLLRYVGLADPTILYRGLATQLPLPLSYGAN